MQARPPAQNVILRESSPRQLSTGIYPRSYAQVRIDPWDLGVAHGLRERREPALRLPLVRVRTPDVRVGVRRHDAYEDRCVLGDEELVHHPPVDSTDWVSEREYRVFAHSGSRLLAMKGGRREEDTHSLNLIGAGTLLADDQRQNRQGFRGESLTVSASHDTPHPGAEAQQDRHIRYLLRPGRPGRSVSLA